MLIDRGPVMGHSAARRVFIWQWGRLGAGPRYAYELAWALRKFTGARTLLSLSNQAEIIPSIDSSEVDFPVTTYGNAQEAIRRTLSLAAILKELEDFVEATKPELAVCAMPGYWDNLVTRRLERLGVPVVVLVHDPVSHPGDSYQLLLALQRLLIRSATGVVTLSQYVMDRLHEQRLLKEHHRKVIAHAAFAFPDLALPPVEPRRYPQGRKLRLLLAGRLKQYKGAGLFLDAMARLPLDRITARIAGEAPVGAQREWADKLPACEFDLKWLSEAELVGHIDWSDIVVAPYVEASQSGLVALAHARGRPVVATDIGGLPEQIEHGVNGLIARDATPDALARSLKTLVDDPAAFNACAGGALAWSRREISWQNTARTFAAFFEEILGGKAGVKGVKNSDIELPPAPAAAARQSTGRRE